MNKEVKRRYLTGIIGAIIIGAVAAIPLIYMYIYKTTFLSLLTILVPIGAMYGYSLFRGKINKKAGLINLLVTILIISIAVLIVIPMLTLKEAEYPITFNTIKQLYTYNEFKLVLFRNYMLSEVFAILGSILISIKLQYQFIDFRNRKDYKISLLEEKPLSELKQESIRILKPIFEKYNAMDKENSILKDEVLAEAKDKKSSQYFSYLKDLKIIRKNKSKYYYNIENEKNEKTNKRSISAVLVTVVTIIIAAIIISFTQIVVGDTVIAWDENIRFDVPTDWYVLDSYNRETGWSYYKFISNEESAEKSEPESKTDYPAVIQIYYDTDIEKVNSVDEVKERMDTYFKNQLSPDIYYIEDSTTANGYMLVKARIQFLTTEYVETEFVYYIVKDSKIAYITAITYNQDDVDSLEEYINTLADSIHWEK